MSEYKLLIVLLIITPLYFLQQTKGLLYAENQDGLAYLSSFSLLQLYLFNRWLRYGVYWQIPHTCAFPC